MAITRDYFQALYGEEPRSSSLGRRFHRLCGIIDDLDKRKPALDEIRDLLSRFEKRRDNTKSQELFAEYELICGHLSWLGSLQGDGELTSKYRYFSSFTEREGLIGRSDQEYSDRASISFLLPNHERSISADNNGTTEYRRDLFETLQRERFFPKILSVINAVWPKSKLGISPQTLDAHLLMRNNFIQFMHKQLLQNALTHAYADVTFNRNYAASTRSHFAHEGDDFLFGVLAYLEVQVLDPKKSKVADFSAELASFHPNLGERGPAVHEQLRQRKTRLCSFSYCDSGPGIERHLRQFSPDRVNLPKEFDTRYVLDNKLSGRMSINSGEGLADVRTLAQQANAILIIETPGSIYIDDITASVEFSGKNNRVSRGTSVSILIEV
jgi:hypothetical protein